MKMMNEIQFEGTIYYIQGDEEDDWALDEFRNEPTLGFDCLWAPELSNNNNQRKSTTQDGDANPIELIQLSTLETEEKSGICIIWMLAAFQYQIPPGLFHLLGNDKIVKVGCGLKSDFGKLEQHGLYIRPVPNQDWWAGQGFIDIQNPYRLNQIEYTGKTSIEALTVAFLGTRLIKTPEPSAQSHWSQIQKDDYMDLRVYAATHSWINLRLHEEQQKVYYDIFQPDKLETLSSYDNTNHYTNTYTSLLYIEQTAQVEHLAATTCLCKIEKSKVAGRVIVRREELSSLENTPFFLLGESRYVSITAENEHSPISTGILEKIASEDDIDFGDFIYFPSDPSPGLDFHVQNSIPVIVKGEYNPTPIRRMNKALQTWNDRVDPYLSDIILGKPVELQANPLLSLPEFKFPKIQGHKLNASQINAIKFATQSRFAMIHGPPGTGKTHTLAGLLHFLYYYSNSNILVCAPSNEAVDNLAAMAIPTLDPSDRDSVVIVKALGREALPARKDLEKYHLHHKFPIPKHLLFSKDRNARTTRNQIIDERKDYTAGCRMVFATLSNSGGVVLEKLDFGYLVVDEASQCLEPEILIAISHRVQGLTLAGDHKQLRPVVFSNRIIGTEMEKSMFERLSSVPEMKPFTKFLDTQYRMHPVLCEWSNMNIYENQLRNGVTIADRTPSSNNFEWKDVKVPLMLLHMVGKQTSKSSSFMNRAEANVVLDIFYYLIDVKRVPLHTIGIISPYSAQINYIRKKLYADDIRHPIAHTITEYQGREADYIILSFVRSTHIESPNPNHDSTPSLGFSTDVQRLNVALTRARNGLFIIGDVSLLQTHPLGKSVADFCDSKDAVHVLNNSYKPGKLSPSRNVDSVPLSEIAPYEFEEPANGRSRSERKRILFEDSGGRREGFGGRGRRVDRGEFGNRGEGRGAKEGRSSGNAILSRNGVNEHQRYGAHGATERPPRKMHFDARGDPGFSGKFGGDRDDRDRSNGYGNSSASSNNCKGSSKEYRFSKSKESSSSSSYGSGYKF